ncbi:MAG: hypothetical protein ACREM2_00030 [Vulcanimicrobiaceae bacterium]
MTTSNSTESSRAGSGRLLAGTAVFLITLIAGLLYVKWLPYYAKSFKALAKHTLGASIIVGPDGVAHATGWAAAWGYALAYYNAIWEALLLALILGATVQVLVPRRWIHRLLGRSDFRSIALAGTLSLGGMM